jgi:hypothetical protein
MRSMPTEPFAKVLVEASAAERAALLLTALEELRLRCMGAEREFAESLAKVQPAQRAGVELGSLRCVATT